MPVGASTGTAGDSPQPSLRAVSAVIASYSSAQYGAAEDQAMALVQAFPEHPFGWKALGVIFQSTGRSRQALAPLETAIQIKSDDAECHNTIGNALKDLGRLTEAEGAYRKAIDREPYFAEAFSNLGGVLNDLGRPGEAEESCNEAIRINTNLSEAHNNLGTALRDLGRSSEAEASYAEAIRLRPEFAEAHSNLGVLLGLRGLPAEAEASYREAIRIRPDFAEVYSNLGSALTEQGRFSEAEIACREAIHLNAGCAQAHSNLGNALRSVGRLSEAEASYREAIRIQPDCAEAHSNLGNVLMDAGRLAEAGVCYWQAISYAPAFADAHYNQGNLKKAAGDLSGAEVCYRQAIDLKPGILDAHLNLSISLLLQARFEEGLRLYEHRWDAAKSLKGCRRDFQRPLWLGQELLRGKRILIHAEQGLGDTIQFCRYLKQVKGLGAWVAFEVQPALIPLLSGLEGVDELIAKGQPLPEFEYHCPLLSLPLAFKTSLESIPAPSPYLFAQSERVARWAKRLGVDGYKIGVCWKSSAAIKERSIPIELFAVLSSIPGVRLISLHKGEGEKELATLPDGMRVEALGSDFDADGAFLDTAAVIDCCDLVITTDTSVAHLAGALGASTWVALPYVPDWRWMMERADSPWYPTVRLFRQSAAGEWGAVLEQMSLSLQAALRPSLKKLAG